MSNQCDFVKKPKIRFPYEFISDMSAGHLLLEQAGIPVKEEINTDILIVGGGIAGMTAAQLLRDQAFFLCEVSDRLGGTSSAYPYADQWICQGAHYDLAYPEHYGREVLDFMKALNLIHFDQFHRLWTFRDQQFLIPSQREQRCYDHGQFREEVLPDGPEKRRFIELLSPYTGSMTLPTRLIEAPFRALNKQTFLSWITARMPLSEAFRTAIDYNLKDDYGAGADAISTLAGIHYYTCRPYFQMPVDLFSPPEGNHYFIRKLAEGIPPSRLLTNHLIAQIGRNRNGVFADAIDVKKRIKRRFRPRKIIFAGPKYMLKYIHPGDYPLFEKITYAPWVVINLVLSKTPPGPVFWQNELLTANQSVLGFVNTLAQYQSSDAYPVLSVYCCFAPEQRQYVADIPLRADDFLSEILQLLEPYFGSGLQPYIHQAFIKLMGHAMPIPGPGYLFSGTPLGRTDDRVIYAGVDNGRLPLLFEAIDSGLLAARLALD